VHVVSANVGPQTPLPQDGVIQITFDRYLSPLSVNRQGVALRDLFGGAPDSPIVQYDPVTRVVTMSNPNPGQPWLEVGKTYEVFFPIATSEAGSFGLRAIDNATMDPATQPLGFSIAPPTGNPPALPKIDFCTDVFPLFTAKYADPSFANFGGRCTNRSCHATQTGDATYSAATGLVLSSPEGIRHTALGVAAAETTTGGTSTSLSPQFVFPAGMPIIDPGNPGDSYLIYKLLLPDEDGSVPDAGGASISYTPCSGSITPPFDYGPGASFASPDEAARLSAHVQGRRMPWGNFLAGGDIDLQATPLTLDEIERIRLWIAQGAQVDDCSCLATSP
jgi:hypothetical protein